MKTYKITIAYDGTDFLGWQSQPNKRGIANKLEKRFEQLFHKNIKLLAASRTDKGVHAVGQVARFKTDLELELSEIQRVWNKALPESIVIKNIEEIKKGFHPIKETKQKTYHYHFFLEQPSPLIQRFGYFFPYKIDLKLLEEALQVFCGEHDFRSFCSEDERDDMIRTIDSISLDYNEELQAHRITIKAKGFLRYMIRRIVGACFEVASKNLSVDVLKKALEEKDPRQTLPKAPAKGLMLYEVKY